MHSLYAVTIFAVLGLCSATDPCLDVLYADKNYGECCGQGNYKQAGHQSVCHELQKERRAEGDARNIDFHKEPADSKVCLYSNEVPFRLAFKFQNNSINTVRA